MNLRSLTISEIHEGLVKTAFTCVDLCTAYLDHIDAKNEQLNAFITVIDRDVVIEHARAVDAKILAGETISQLEGVPYGAKDIYCTKGVRTTAASKMLENFTPEYNATVIDRLNNAGAILLGKLNMDEFAMGGSGENSAFGVTSNPWDEERVCGGSSSGSAAAVASGMCVFALGTDTGGSIRQPASFCGVVGWKPTYGRVSRSGVIPMASSLDTMGLFASCVDDVVLIQEVIAGLDKMDSTTSDKEVCTLDALSSDAVSTSGLRVGIPQEYVKHLSPEIATVFQQQVDRFREMGAEIVDISLPMTDHGLPTYYIVCPCEVSANMERYDGIRFGIHPEGIETLDDQYMITRDVGLGDEVKRRILIGTYALSAGYYDAYYAQSQKVRTKIIDDFESAFSQCDVLLTPPTPGVAFKKGEKNADPLAMYAEDIFMVPASLAGLTGIVIPATMIDGMPYGVQLLAPQFGEKTLFGVAKVFEVHRGTTDRVLE